MTFSGFPKDFFTFFSDLAENNDRAWFTDHKQRYEESVVAPCLDFISAMAPELKKISPHFNAIPKKTGGSMFRIYRDTRFSNDKSPYKTNAGLHFRHARARDAHAPGFYLHLEPGRVFYGGGLWRPPTPALTQIRTAIDDNRAAWQKLKSAAAFRRQFGELGDGDPLKRPPKGFTPDHPLIDDLKKRSFFAVAEDTQSAAQKPAFVKDVASAYRSAGPFVEFLCKAVGAPF